MAGSNLDKAYQELGTAILVDKERGRRPYAYAAWMIVGYSSGHGLYRLWLMYKHYGNGHDHYYSFSNNIGWYILSGLVGAIVAIGVLKMYFRRKDQKHNKVLDKL